MRIAICDDNIQELEVVTDLIKEFSESYVREDKIEINSFSNGIELLNQLDNKQNFDVYILDIIMPNLNGIQLAEEIRSKDNVAKIIFLTSSKEFAVDSYSVDAFHYLIKPIKIDKLFSLLEKACQYVDTKTQQYIVVKIPSSLSKIFFSQLINVEIQKRTLSFYQKNNKKLETTNTISQVESLLLKDKRFIKPHRSYIVNMDYIKHLTQDGITTTDNRFIPVSRNLYKEVKNEYINYSFKAKE